MTLQTILDLFTLVLILPSSEHIPIPSSPPRLVWQSLQRVARQLELVGPHERWANDFRQEVAYCRRALEDCHNAPWLHDAQRFDRARSLLPFWERRREFLQARRYLALHQAEAIDAALSECDHVLCRLELLRISQDEAHSWASRRRSLTELQRLIGPASWFAGRVVDPSSY